MRLLQVLTVSLMFLLAGCADDGGSDDNGGGDNGGETGGENGGGSGGGPGAGNETPAPEDVTLSVTLSGAYPANIAYQPSTLTVEAGAMVTLTFTNDDVNPLVSHDWALEGFEETAQTATVGNGESTSVTFQAPTTPGDYAFYCSLPGHRANGMEGTLTVT